MNTREYYKKDIAINMFIRYHREKYKNKIIII